MKNKKYLTQEEANEYDAHAEFEKRNFINEIRYQEGYYDNDEEIRYSEERYWDDLCTWNERHSY
tara:strand:- start:259 stop:450 length:192 start_codon:yes stop_codon:yes gene_type:complete